jgi:hypothetical protein
LAAQRAVQRRILSVFEPIFGYFAQTFAKLLVFVAIFEKKLYYAP